MADPKKLSELDPAASLVGDELAYAVQGGESRRTTVDDIAQIAVDAQAPVNAAFTADITELFARVGTTSTLAAVVSIANIGFATLEII